MSIQSRETMNRRWESSRRPQSAPSWKMNPSARRPEQQICEASKLKLYPFHGVHRKIQDGSDRLVARIGRCRNVVDIKELNCVLFKNINDSTAAFNSYLQHLELHRPLLNVQLLRDRSPFLNPKSTITLVDDHKQLSPDMTDQVRESIISIISFFDLLCAFLEVLLAREEKLSSFVESVKQMEEHNVLLKDVLGQHIKQRLDGSSESTIILKRIVETPVIMKARNGRPTPILATTGTNTESRHEVEHKSEIPESLGEVISNTTEAVEKVFITLVERSDKSSGPDTQIPILQTKGTDAQRHPAEFQLEDTLLRLVELERAHKTQTKELTFAATPLQDLINVLETDKAKMKVVLRQAESDKLKHFNATKYEVEMLRSRIIALEDQNKRQAEGHRAETEKSKVEMLANQCHLSTFEGENRRLKESTAVLAGDLEECEGKIKLLYGRHVEVEKCLKTLQLENESLELDLKSAREALSRSKAEISALDGKTRVLVEHLEATESSLRGIVAEKDNLSDENKQHLTDIKTHVLTCKTQSMKIVELERMTAEILQFPDLSNSSEPSGLKFDQRKFATYDVMLKGAIKSNIVRIELLERKNEDFRDERVKLAYTTSKQLNDHGSLHIDDPLPSPHKYDITAKGKVQLSELNTSQDSANTQSSRWANLRAHQDSFRPLPVSISLDHLKSRLPLRSSSTTGLNDDHPYTGNPDRKAGSAGKDRRVTFLDSKSEVDLIQKRSTSARSTTSGRSSRPQSASARPHSRGLLAFSFPISPPEYTKNP